MDAVDPSWSRLGLAAKAALVGIGTFISVGLFSMGPALPRLAADFSGTPNAGLLVQLIAAVVAPVFALAAPVAGKLISRFGIRPVYIASVLLIAVGGAGPAACHDLWSILALRVVLAVGVAGGFTAGMSGIARLPDSQRATVLGLNSFVGGGICLPLFPLIGALAQDSWRHAFLMHLILLPIALLALALPGQSATPGAASEGAEEPRRAGLLAGLPPALAAVTALAGLTMVASSMYTPFVLGTIGIAQPAQIGQVLAVMSLCSLAGSGSYGFLHARLGTSGLLRIGLASMAAGCLLVGLAASLVPAMVGMGLMGIGLAAFAASTYAAAIESIAQSGNAPAAMGVITFCLYGAQVAFPAITSTVGATYGPGAVFLVLATFMAIALGLAVSQLRLPREAAPA